NTFEITQVSTNGSQIITSSKSFGTQAPTIGIGIIYRPTKGGFPLITVNTPATILANSLNTATIAIDNSMGVHSSGTSLPSQSGIIGDVILNTTENALYRLEGAGWVPIPPNSIPTVYANPITSAPPQNKGDVVNSYWDSKNYVYNGSAWVAPVEMNSLPESAKFGDVFYVTTERKLYMMDDDGNWNNISSSSIPGGTDNDIPDDN